MTVVVHTQPAAAAATHPAVPRRCFAPPLSCETPPLAFTVPNGVMPQTSVRTPTARRSGTAHRKEAETANDSSSLVRSTLRGVKEITQAVGPV